MNNVRSFWLVMACLTGVSAYASDPAQTCNDMYPADSYEAEDRHALLQECMAAYSSDSEGAYSGDGESSMTENSNDASYYEGTVEDYVGEIPAEEPVPVEEPAEEYQ